MLLFLVVIMAVASRLRLEALVSLVPRNKDATVEELRTTELPSDTARSSCQKFLCGVRSARWVISFVPPKRKRRPFRGLPTYVGDPKHANRHRTT